MDVGLVNFNLLKKLKSPILNRDHIYKTDFYCPFKDKRGEVDRSREIFEFCMDKRHCKLQQEHQFLMSDITERQWLRYLVLSVQPDERNPEVYKIRSILKGRF